MGAWGELRDFAAYVAALRRFLASRLTPDEATRRVRQQLAGRERTFLRLLAEAVFANPRNPFHRLFRHAGIELGDVRRLVQEHGLDDALARLYDEGVRVTIDELKGDAPIRRGSLEFEAHLADFDNPLAARHFELRTGGSRGGGMPVGADLEMVEYEACYVSELIRAFDLRRTRTGVWFPAPPTQTGLQVILRDAKVGNPVERWFSQTDPSWRSGYWKHVIVTRASLLASRLAGTPFPAPEHTTTERVAAVARWLAEVKAGGWRPVLVTNPGFAVRICVAARDLGLDIGGAFFRTGGEPYTAGKAAVIDDAGCRVANSYFLMELGGFAGLACPNADEFDEVHLLTDKLAVAQRDRSTGPAALAYTTIHALCPKLLINFESDDIGVVRERACGCELEAVGLSLHLHGIHSYEKLTSEGVTFLGSDVITLLEQALPSRFGGAATDYQLVEHEQDGVRRVAILISPAVGDVHEAEVIETAIDFLRSRGKVQSIMVDVWAENGTLHVMRRAPYVTDAAKTPALHVLHERA